MTSTRPAEVGRELDSRLQLFSQAALKKIAQTLGVPANSGDLGYAGALAAYIGTPRHHAVLEGRLPADLWPLLTLLPLQTGPFRPRVLIVALVNRGRSADDALAEIVKLLTYGCLLPTDGLPGTQRLGVDARTLRNWLSSLRFEVPRAVLSWAAQRQPRSHPPRSVEAPATVAPPELEDLRRASYILLAEAAAKPIRLTLKGAPYKAEVTRLASALAGSPATSARGAKRKAEPLAVPPILWFSLAALVGGNLLEERNQELHPSGDVGEFLGASVVDQARRLLDGWRVGPFDDFTRIPTLDFPGFADAGAAGRVPWFVLDDWDTVTPSQDKLIWARSLICTAIAGSSEPSPDAWHRIDDLAHEIYADDPEILFETMSDYDLFNPHVGTAFYAGTPAIAPYFGIARAPGASTENRGQSLIRGQDWLEVEGAFVRQVIGESMRWLGLVEAGPDAIHPEVFRLTELGRHLLLGHPVSPGQSTLSARVIVQPNFEVVVVDALANAALLAQLNDFAERRSFDRAATYRLSQDALLRGLQSGWTGLRILETLENVNSGPIPQNVRFTLQEWIHRFESMSVREKATILEADSAAQLERWLADRSIGPLLGERLGPTTVLVPANHVTGVARRVEQATKQLVTIDYAKPRTRVLEVLDPDLIELEEEDPFLDYQMRAFSTRVGEAGGATTYRISPETVSAARRAGRRASDLVDFLVRAGGSPLPADFLVRLLGWSGAVSPVTFEPQVVVYLEDEIADWDVIVDIPSIAPLIRSVLTSSLALVAPGDLEALRAELAGRGIALQAGVVPAEALTPEPDELASPGESDLIRTALSRILGGPPGFPDPFANDDSPWPPRRR